MRCILRRGEQQQGGIIPMSRTTNKTRALVQLSLLIALEAVMAFTPLGFIMIPPISITILHIPVIIGPS